MTYDPKVSGRWSDTDEAPKPEPGPILQWFIDRFFDRFGRFTLKGKGRKP